MPVHALQRTGEHALFGRGYLESVAAHPLRLTAGDKPISEFHMFSGLPEPADVHFEVLRQARDAETPFVG